MPTPQGLTQAPTSFIGSRCQGIHHLLLVACRHKDAHVHCEVLNIRPAPPHHPRPPPHPARNTPQPDAQQVRRPWQPTSNQTHPQEHAHQPTADAPTARVDPSEPQQCALQPTPNNQPRPSTPHHPTKPRWNSTTGSTSHDQPPKPANADASTKEANATTPTRNNSGQPAATPNPNPHHHQHSSSSKPEP